MANRRQERQAGKPQHRQPQQQQRFHQRQGQQVAQNAHGADGHTVRHQHRQCEKRRQRSGQRVGCEVRNPHRQAAFQLPGKVRRALYAQDGAERKLKPQVAGHISILQPQQQRRRAGRGQQIDGLQEPVSQNGEQKHKPCAQHRNRQPGEKHIADDDTRLQGERRMGKPAFAREQKPRQQGNVQPRHRQQMGYPGGSKGVAVSVRQAGGVPQQHRTDERCRIGGHPAL